MLQKSKIIELAVKFFYTVFLGCFLWLFLNVILNVQTTTFDAKPVSIFNPLIIIILAIVFLTVLFILYTKLFYRWFNSDQKAFIFLVCAMVVVVIIQIIFAYELRLVVVGQLSTDFGVLSDAAQTIARGEVCYNDYFFKLPYQNMTALLLALMYKIGLIFGVESFNAAAITLNIFMIDTGMVLLFLTLKKIKGNAPACFALFLAALFLPYYTYVPYFYTDPLSMPFSILTIYLYLYILDRIESFDSLKAFRFWKHEKGVSVILYCLLLGFVIFMGYAVKGSTIITAVAIGIHFIFSCVKKWNLRKWILMIFVVIGFVGCTFLYPIVVDQMGCFPYKQRDAGTIPVVPHYLMMGLNDERYGAWNVTDYQTTFDNTATKQERAQRAYSVIKQRLSDYKLEGYIKFITQKTTWEWGDGTYFAPAKLALPHEKESLLHQFFLWDGKYYKIYAYCSQIFQITLLGLILASIYKWRLQGKANAMFIINLTIFGVYLFFAIWEARSRYLLNFTPLFFISAVDGAAFLFKKISEKYQYNLKNQGDVEI